MKKGLTDKIFITVFLAVILIPFVSMSFAKSDSTAENRKLAELPSIKTDNGINTEYLSGLGEYFEDHFAFRQQIVSADSVIQSKLFHTSNIPSVVVGKNGWLYYCATLDDFQGNDLISERGLYNISHNIKMLQDYVEENGSEFLFTVAPNKNTLYGENMPYYCKVKAGEGSNMENLVPLLEKEGINYVDLFELFKQQDSVLYFKRDSHWTNTGAALVHNELLDKLNVPHTDYTVEKYETLKDHSGDLNKMIYPLSSFTEQDNYYKTSDSFEYITKTQSVEDAWIMTKNENAQSSLLMYRDSFGNSLLEFFADTFSLGCFSKSASYNIASQLSLYEPEYVIAEKVERNISDYAEFPPIFMPSQCMISTDGKKDTDSVVSMSECETNPSFWTITGQLNGIELTDNDIYIRITDGDELMCFDTFGLTDNGCDNCCCLYIDKQALSSDIIKTEIIVEQEQGNYVVCESTVNINEIPTSQEDI